VNSPKGQNSIRISGAAYIMIALDFVASFATSAISFYVAYVVPVLGRANAVDPSPRRSIRGLYPARRPVWLVALVAGGESFSPTLPFIASPIGILLLFLCSVGLIDVASLSTDV
jgi:hypothetical protein